MMKDNWHKSASARKEAGDKYETLFEQSVACKCGGKFVRVGGGPGEPDFKCDSCGQLVDVKSSPIAGGTGNISISSIPWKHYASSTLIAAMVDSVWRGEYKKNIRPINDRPNAPTHSERATNWYLISLDDFNTLESLGYSVIQSHVTYTKVWLGTVGGNEYAEAMRGYVVIDSSWPNDEPAPILIVRKAE